MHLGRLFTSGFSGTNAPPELLSLIKDGLGGVILFQRNIESPEQIRNLIFELKRSAAPRPLVVSIDQEGGRVVRLRGRPWAELPPMRVFGESPNAEARVGALGRLLALELRSIGIDLNFAPVLDVDTNPANPVIGDRSFARDPELVANLGAAFISEMQQHGVASCGKHFPGHGDTQVDSHLALPTIRHGMARLTEVELLPFKIAVEADVAAVMTAHVVCTALDAELPATLSTDVLRLLRHDLGFNGAIVSDDLEMRAIGDRWPLSDAAWRAVAAGCDQLLVCSEPDRVRTAIAGVEDALRRGDLGEERVDDAIAHWNTVADRYARSDANDLEWLASEDHRTRIGDVLRGLS